jgi:glycosyltransferase involved in cell wall biosynthesis
MRYYIVIPSHNEEEFIALTLQSLVDQTVLPAKIVVVNDIIYMFISTCNENDKVIYQKYLKLNKQGDQMVTG